MEILATLTMVVCVHFCLAYKFLILNHEQNREILIDKLLGCKCRRDFTYYADVCFREFGDRVLYWTTVNEPNVFAFGGYDHGISPPQRCSPPFCAIKSNKGNSTYESYFAVHHILLAHASAARLYRRKYRVYHLILHIYV